MAWELVNPFGILNDEALEGDRDTAWHAGQVNDILSLEPGYILVGSETGGVWFIDSTYKAMALSDDWLYPDVECLAHGPGGSHHIFAGCHGGLYEAIISRKYPFAPWKSINLPGHASVVYRVVATQEPPRIAIATDAGIWWADGQPPPGGYPSGRYNWQPVKNLPQEGFFGLALSPDGIIAGVRNSVAPATRRGIYCGRWSDGLTMHRAAVYLPQKAIANMRFISIASCHDHPRHAYAMAVAPDGHVMQVLRSDDGGQQWNPCPKTLEGNHDGSWDIAKFCGNFANGGWHKTISVHHQNPEVVAFGGWRALLSRNGGMSWRGLGGDFTSPDRWDYANKHQHDDVHAVYFEPGYSDNRLYIASDGGVVQCQDWN
jgi:hypothetical protein